MKFFKSKTDKPNLIQAAECLPLDVVHQLIKSFAIGNRVRYFVDMDEETCLESLIIGYAINRHIIFYREDLEQDELDGNLVVNVDGFQDTITHLKNFSLLLPSDIGEERKLDYQTRVAIGRRGPFAVGKSITLMSLCPRRENLRAMAEVRRNLLIKEGMHAGHTMALLDVDLSSVEAFDARSETRVEINVPATVQVEGKDRVLPAFILDISEKALRLVLDPPDTPASAFKPRAPLVVKITLSQGRSPVALQGVIFQQRQREYVVRIEKIARRGEFVAFEMLDAMELKIVLQDESRQHQTLN